MSTITSRNLLKSVAMTIGCLPLPASLLVNPESTTHWIDHTLAVLSFLMSAMYRKSSTVCTPDAASQCISNQPTHFALCQFYPRTTPGKCFGTVCQLQCQDCDSGYVGETARTLLTRIAEHPRPSNNNSPVGDPQNAGHSKV